MRPVGKIKSFQIVNHCLLFFDRFKLGISVRTNLGIALTYKDAQQRQDQIPNQHRKLFLLSVCSRWWTYLIWYFTF
jgi:hypothetical protein